VDNFYPQIGDTITITVSGGHHFPENGVLIAERLLHNPEIVAPDGSVNPLTLKAQNNCWKSHYVIRQSGVHSIRIALKKPQVDEPLFYGKALVIAGGKDDPEKYREDNPLDVILGTALSRYSPGDNLALKIFKNGQPVSGTLSLIPADEKENFLTVTPRRPAEFHLKNPGIYLANASESGVSCSVTFAIKR